MDRTRRLLMSVTASALLAGSSGTNPHLGEVNATTTNSEKIEPDPQTQSEQVVLTLLEAVELENAMSLDEILSKEPSLTRNRAQQVLKKLVVRGKIQKTGDGRDQLYRYYNPRAADNRKLAEASQTVSGLVRGVQEEDAISLNELLAKRPGLDRDLATKAIQGLLSQGQIRRTGDDSRDNPFRYYDRSRGGHGM